jgi:hypothetical protein
MKNMLESYSVLLEEVGFNGNRSPWEEGQYEIANDGLVTFEPRQNRARTTISMLPDALRETDREVTILVREADNAEGELVRINLPQNTIAFTDSQVLVREADPAVQIDVVRFKPDSTSVEVSYASSIFVRASDRLKYVSRWYRTPLQNSAKRLCLNY